MNNKIVKAVKETKLLGITIDNNINFKEHIHIISSKISKSLGIMYKIKSIVPKSVLSKMYYSFIYPYLIYGNEIWGATDYCHTEALFLLQKKAIRIITGSEYLAHTSPLFKEMKILKLKDINKYMTAVRMYKRNYSGDVTRSDHTHNTRNGDNIIPTYQRLTKTQHAFSHIGPRIWNTIPITIRNSETVAKFKKDFKNELLRTYTDI